MATHPNILLVFVDGFGLAPRAGPGNPLDATVAPHLLELIAEHANPIDACLGVEGLPQSATGQTALLTGVNAPAAMGRHIEGFPGPGLCRIIQRHNIFQAFVDGGLRATFANGYYVGNTDEARRLRLRSVTTVATLSAFGHVRDRDDIRRDDAVCQDVTRASLRSRGYTGPLRTAEAAADDLARIAAQHHFTLFEFFQTDRAGHACDHRRAANVLHLLDTFIAPLMAAAQRGEFLLALSSDHGNIEDLATHTHTTNPVPFATLGPGDTELREGVASLVDVTPASLTHSGIPPADA